MLERFDTGQFFKIRLSAAATSTRHWQPKAAASATHNLLPIRKYKEKTHPTDITFFEFARGTGRNRRVANCGPTSPKSGGGRTAINCSHRFRRNRSAVLRDPDCADQDFAEFPIRLDRRCPT